MTPAPGHSLAVTLADNPRLVRVGVPTFRRPTLLAQALASLRAQTHEAWVATVYNDDPGDPAPAALVAALDDPRLSCVAPPARLGPVSAFNLAYTHGNEPFFALLEDDNTWDPDFLARLLACLEAHPDTAGVGCNQRIREEQSDGSWRDTSTTVRPVVTAGPRTPRPIPWGEPALATGSTLSNGALLLRRAAAARLVTPADLPFAGVEAVRQRLLPHPLLYLPETLATYSKTRVTARSGDGHRWGALQTLLLATFVRHAKPSDLALQQLWTYWRRQQPAPTHLALHAALSCPGCRPLLACAGLIDWLRFFKTVLGRPAGAWACLHARRDHPDWWSVLDSATAHRFAEARAANVPVSA
ncbi:MAG: glycosyltransferase family A protein [Opitutaceae bacterium]